MLKIISTLYFVTTILACNQAMADDGGLIDANISIHDNQISDNTVLNGNVKVGAGLGGSIGTSSPTTAIGGVVNNGGTIKGTVTIAKNVIKGNFLMNSGDAAIGGIINKRK